MVKILWSWTERRMFVSPALVACLSSFFPALTLHFRLDNTSSYMAWTTYTQVGDTYTYMLYLPQTCDHLYYYFTASDAAGNTIGSSGPSPGTITTSTYYTEVNMPMLGTAVISPASPKTGDTLNITIEVKDNEKVMGVTLNYNDDGTWKSTPMTYYKNDL